MIKNIISQLVRHPTKKNEQRTPNDIKQIILHCTGMKQMAAGAQKTIEAIAKYDTSPNNHISATGCASYTYHYTIGEDGDIYKTLEDTEVSWHVGRWNKICLGVCLIYDPADETLSPKSPAAKQLGTALNLIAVKCLQLGLFPSDVQGHRELETTGWKMINGEKKLVKSCPGMKVNLEQCRKQVAVNMQTILSKLGFYTDKIDGIFGPKSMQAEEKFLAKECHTDESLLGMI